MKAIVYSKFGSPDVLRLTEVKKPEPAENEILLEVHSASVNAYDWRHVKADPFLIRFMGAGIFKPSHPILGADMAGIVLSVGSKAKKFKPGDRVFGEGGYGGFAEYACIDENKLALIPDKIGFDEAAAAPMAALTALQGLRDKGKIRDQHKVLINGASGGVGSFAVQIARSFGAEVTGVCSTSKTDFVRSLHAEHIIDYRKEDITKSGKRYDIIFDVAAYRPAGDYKRILAPGGVYIMAGGSIGRIFKMMFRSATGDRNMTVLIASVNQADLTVIAGLLESGRIKSRIDKRYPLEQTAEAIRYLEQGKASGKVVISVLSPPD